MSKYLKNKNHNNIYFYKDSVYIIDEEDWEEGDDFLNLSETHIVYGKEFKDNFLGDIWSQDEINQKMKDFIYGIDFGIDAEGTATESKKHHEALKGNLLGIYPNPRKDKYPSDTGGKEWSLVLYYNQKDKTIYVLTLYEFGEQFKTTWNKGVDENSQPKTDYYKEGQQLTQWQRNALRQLYPQDVYKQLIQLTEQEKEAIENKIKAEMDEESGSLSKKEFEKEFNKRLKKALEILNENKESRFGYIDKGAYYEGKMLPEDRFEKVKEAMERIYTPEQLQTIKEIAQKRNMTERQMIELIGRQTYRTPYDRIYESLVKYQDAPYLFVNDRKSIKKDSEEYLEVELPTFNFPSNFRSLKNKLENAKTINELEDVMEYIYDLRDEFDLSRLSFEKLNKIYEKAKVNLKDSKKHVYFKNKNRTKDGYKKPLWVDDLLLDQICSRDYRIDSESKLCEKLVELGSTDNRFNAIFVKDWVKKTHNKYHFE